MASPIEITGAIIQYAFIDRVNTVSKKYSFSALIPWDENCPQCQAIINASNSEWAKVSAGAKKAQSMGYMILAANDTAHIHPDVMKMLDPNRYYLQVRPVQDENTTTPIALYDTVPQLIGNRNIVGNGTIANYKAVAYGYDSAGQKGVKYYAQWLQILNLVENTNANTGPVAAATGGYVADAAALTPPPVMQQPVVQQQAMPAANVMPAAPTTIPGTQAYAAPAVNVMPAAPVAQPAYATPVEQVAQPAYAAPVEQVAQPAYAAPLGTVYAPAQPVYAAPAAPAPAAPIAPVAAAPIAPVAQPVYAAPAAPAMPAAPVMPGQ